jgi:hypothetical protein
VFRLHAVTTPLWVYRMRDQYLVMIGRRANLVNVNRPTLYELPYHWISRTSTLPRR